MFSAKIKWVGLFVLLMWSAAASAACSGSGTAWNCSAGSSSNDVNSALSSAADGATITFAAGSYNWSSFANFSNSKGATLICASVGACVVTPNGTVVGMNGSLSGTNTKLYRISGFTFQNGGGGPSIWFYGQGTMTKLRIDNNTFKSYSDSAVAIYLGENSTVASFYGVIDHNNVTNATNMMLVHTLGGTNNSPPTATRGSANNMFIEDNKLTFTTMSNAGQGCIDGWGGNAVVFRQNQTTNCLVTQHGVVHNGGPFNFELYNNTLKVTSGANGVEDCYRCFHHQGSGEFIAFNNTFISASGKSGSALEVTHYRSATPSAAGYDSSIGRCDGSNSKDGNRSGMQGYPCWRQPGRDGFAKLQPMYVWGNKWSDGSKVDLSIGNPWGASNPSVDTHVANNRDFYNAVSASAQTSSTSPFNGASGMGFGSLANRPSSCTTNAAESGGGVGYFAVDQGAQGTLYRCSATNTWAVQYVPYTYPHPLVTGSAGAPSTSLVAPSNLTIQ